MQSSTHLLTRKRLIRLKAEQPHSSGRDDAVAFVDHVRLPDLCLPASCDRRRDRSQPSAGPYGANEARVVLQADHMLPALAREEVSAHGGEGLDDAAVHAAVDDPITL